MNNPESVSSKSGAYSTADIDAITQFLKNENIKSFFGTEPFLLRLERKLASLCDKKFCLALNSGTSSLFAAYFALGLQAGDLVLAPSNTFYATVTPLVQLGVIPVFVDCEADTGNISVPELERLLGLYPQAKAIIVTHLWGHPADLIGLREIAAAYQIPIIEDLSLSLGASRDGILAGSIGKAVCFSLGSTKLMSGGQAGALVTDDPDLYQRAVLLTNFGPRAQFVVMNSELRPYCSTGWGLNNRIHTLAAAVVNGRLDRFDELCSAREVRMSHLCKGLLEHPYISFADRRGVAGGIRQGCMAIVSEQKVREEIAAFMQSKNLEVSTKLNYPALHSCPLFANPPQFYLNTAGLDPRNYQTICPNVEAYLKTCLGFPLFVDEPLELVDCYVNTAWEAVEEIA